MDGSVDTALLAAFRRAVRAKIERDLAEEASRAEELRHRVMPLLRDAVADARRRGLCRGTWLFGSYAWGQPTEESDVDLLADECPDASLFAALVGKSTGTEVHVVRRETAAPELCARAMRDGISL